MSKEHVEEGPGGHPYISDETAVVAYENGEFLLNLRNERGDSLRVNLSREQLEAFRDQIGHTLEESDY